MGYIVGDHGDAKVIACSCGTTWDSMEGQASGKHSRTLYLFNIPSYRSVFPPPSILARFSQRPPLSPAIHRLLPNIPFLIIKEFHQLSQHSPPVRQEQFIPHSARERLETPDRLNSHHRWTPCREQPRYDAGNMFLKHVHTLGNGDLQGVNGRQLYGGVWKLDGL